MAAVLLENIKLIMLFLLVGSLIGLSHRDGGKTTTAPKRLRNYYRIAAGYR